jgi:hypothetical protein
MSFSLLQNISGEKAGCPVPWLIMALDLEPPPESDGGRGSNLFSVL